MSKPRRATAELPPVQGPIGPPLPLPPPSSSYSSSTSFAPHPPPPPPSLPPAPFTLPLPSSTVFNIANIASDPSSTAESRDRSNSDSRSGGSTSRSTTARPPGGEARFLPPQLGPSSGLMFWHNKYNEAMSKPGGSTTLAGGGGGGGDPRLAPAATHIERGHEGERRSVMLGGGGTQEPSRARERVEERAGERAEDVPEPPSPSARFLSPTNTRRPAPPPPSTAAASASTSSAPPPGLGRASSTTTSRSLTLAPLPSQQAQPPTQSFAQAQALAQTQSQTQSQPPPPPQPSRELTPPLTRPRAADAHSSANPHRFPDPDIPAPTRARFLLSPSSSTREQNDLPATGAGTVSKPGTAGAGAGNTSAASGCGSGAYEYMPYAGTKYGYAAVHEQQVRKLREEVEKREEGGSRSPELRREGGVGSGDRMELERRVGSASGNGCAGLRREEAGLNGRRGDGPEMRERTRSGSLGEAGVYAAEREGAGRAGGADRQLKEDEGWTRSSEDKGKGKALPLPLSDESASPQISTDKPPRSAAMGVPMDKYEELKRRYFDVKRQRDEARRERDKAWEDMDERGNKLQAMVAQNARLRREKDALLDKLAEHNIKLDEPSRPLTSSGRPPSPPTVSPIQRTSFPPAVQPATAIQSSNPSVSPLTPSTPAPFIRPASSSGSARPGERKVLPRPPAASSSSTLSSTGADLPRPRAMASAERGLWILPGVADKGATPATATGPRWVTPLLGDPSAGNPSTGRSNDPLDSDRPTHAPNSDGHKRSPNLGSAARPLELLSDEEDEPMPAAPAASRPGSGSEPSPAQPATLGHPLPQAGLNSASVPARAAEVRKPIEPLPMPVTQMEMRRAREQALAQAAAVPGSIAGQAQNHVRAPASHIAPLPSSAQGAHDAQAQAGSKRQPMVQPENDWEKRYAKRARLDESHKSVTQPSAELLDTEHRNASGVEKDQEKTESSEKMQVDEPEASQSQMLIGLPAMLRSAGRQLDGGRDQAAGPSLQPQQAKQEPPTRPTPNSASQSPYLLRPTTPPAMSAASYDNYGGRTYHRGSDSPMGSYAAPLPMTTINPVPSGQRRELEPFDPRVTRPLPPSSLPEMPHWAALPPSERAGARERIVTSPHFDSHLRVPSDNMSALSPHAVRRPEPVSSTNLYHPLEPRDRPRTPPADLPVQGASSSLPVGPSRPAQKAPFSLPPSQPLRTGAHALFDSYRESQGQKAAFKDMAQESIRVKQESPNTERFPYSLMSASDAPGPSGSTPRDEGVRFPLPPPEHPPPMAYPLPSAPTYGAAAAPERPAYGAKRNNPANLPLPEAPSAKERDMRKRPPPPREAERIIEVPDKPLGWGDVTMPMYSRAPIKHGGHNARKVQPPVMMVNPQPANSSDQTSGPSQPYPQPGSSTDRQSHQHQLSIEAEYRAEQDRAWERDKQLESERYGDVGRRSTNRDERETPASREPTSAQGRIQTPIQQWGKQEELERARMARKGDGEGLLMGDWRFKGNREWEVHRSKPRRERERESRGAELRAESSKRDMGPSIAAEGPPSNGPRSEEPLKLEPITMPTYQRVAAERVPSGPGIVTPPGWWKPSQEQRVAPSTEPERPPSRPPLTVTTSLPTTSHRSTTPTYSQPHSHTGNTISAASTPPIPLTRRLPSRYWVPTIPRLLDGSPDMPLKIGKWEIRSLGHIVPRPGYWNERVIWPVGFESEVKYLSMKDPRTEVFYTSRILQSHPSFPRHPGPIFQVIPADLIMSPITRLSPREAWQEVVKQAARVRDKPPNPHVSGTEQFGLASAVTKYLIQELPGASVLRDRGYRWEDIAEDPKQNFGRVMPDIPHPPSNDTNDDYMQMQGEDGDIVMLS